MRNIRVGRFAGLDYFIDIRLIPGAVVFFVVLGLLGEAVLQLPRETALAVAFVAVLLNYLSVLVHQLGHAWAAQHTGYPMTAICIGIRYITGSTLHPPNEPALPGPIHIRRAVGGPIGNLAFSVVAGCVALILKELGEAAVLVGIFFFVYNLVLGLFSFLRLSFSDGKTLVTWWGKKQASAGVIPAAAPGVQWNGDERTERYALNARVFGDIVRWALGLGRTA